VFERYTEKARRVIFFGRYEASQFGAPQIDTEHLLLGVVREDKSIDAEAIRSRIESATPRHQPFPTSADLPLSEASKQVLFHAKDEADRLNSKHIGTEHLFLGLIQEKESMAGRLLHELGADFAAIRKMFEGEVEQAQASISAKADIARRLRSAIVKTVQIHGASWDADYIENEVSRYRAYNWHWNKADWKPKDIAMNVQSGQFSFDLRLVDGSGTFQLVKAGWKRDHCVICQWELCESEDDHGSGYTNGRDWVCLECYERFWRRPDFIAGSYSDMT
jgi:hypothetical protein